ncbi:SPFH domain-containing protein [Streptomyces sp. NPDC002133]|uniref:SPFH domain-containing protein n=1 Tax=Streptomyces sp. NPDC002133 TaxID=3154409 RepID=UPI00332E3749
MTPTTPNPEDTAAPLPPGLSRSQVLSLPVLDLGTATGTTTYAPAPAVTPASTAASTDATSSETATVTGGPKPAAPADPAAAPDGSGTDSGTDPGPVWAWGAVGGLAASGPDGDAFGSDERADAKGADADAVRDKKDPTVRRRDDGSGDSTGSDDGKGFAGPRADGASGGSVDVGMNVPGVARKPSGREAMDDDAGAPAVPAPATAGRRTVVIGAETTGAIPVHLLFRDVPGDSVAAGHVVAPVAGKDSRTDSGKDVAGKVVAGKDDDGGPDTVAMAPVVPSGRRVATAPRVTVVSPSRRPAPPADPKVRERPGPVLPGWAALLVGVVALTGCAAVLHWAGAFPRELTELFRLRPRPYHGIGGGQWALLAVAVVFALFSLGGLGRGSAGNAWVLTLFGEYRGTVRRSGLLWVSPLLLRRSVDVRLRHWRSEPMPAVDANGTALQAVVLVVWRIQDTARAVLSVEDHEEYLREQVEAAMARVLSQLPTDAFHEDAPTLRNAEAVGDALTKTLSAECVPVGIDIFSAQPTRIEYAPEVAAAMRRRRIAAIEAEHRDTVLTSVVDAVDDTVQRLTVRGLVELDDYERKALVRDLTVAFCTARAGGTEAP